MAYRIFFILDIVFRAIRKGYVVDDLSSAFQFVDEVDLILNCWRVESCLCAATFYLSEMDSFLEFCSRIVLKMDKFSDCSIAVVATLIDKGGQVSIRVIALRGTFDVS